VTSHIVKTERAISEQKAEVDKLHEDGQDTKLAVDTLRTFEANLQTMREHRELIIRTIEQIDQRL
jgi:hypothetical protein